MKRRTFVKVLFLIGLLLQGMLPLAAASNSDTRYVSLDPAPLSASASVTARKTGTVDYAEQVRVLETKKNWVRIEVVSNPSVTGWVPSSALTTRKLKPKGTAATANADEIALAGKGFNSTVEAVYVAENGIDISIIDGIEANSVGIDDLLSFIREGKLNGGEE